MTESNVKNWASIPLMDCQLIKRKLHLTGEYWKILCWSPERCLIGWNISSCSSFLRTSSSSMLTSVPLLPPRADSVFLSGMVARSKPSGLSLSLKIFHWEPQLFYQRSQPNLWSFSVWRGSKEVVSVAPCWKGTKGFLHPEICLLSLCSPWLQSSPVPILSCFSLWKIKTWF